MDRVSAPPIINTAGAVFLKRRKERPVKRHRDGDVVDYGSGRIVVCAEIVPLRENITKFLEPIPYLYWIR